VTVTLEYADDLSRVKIVADDLGDATDARIERSVDAVRWTLVRGGAEVPVVDGVVRLDDYEFTPNRPNHYRVLAEDTTQTATITPTLRTMWLKSIGKPFLNVAVTPVGRVTITRAARNGVFDVIGRSVPVAVTDVRQSRRFSIGLDLQDVAVRDRVEYLLSTGDPLLLQVPPGSPVPSMYVVVGDTEYDDEMQVGTLPMIEVAAPSPDIVGSTVLWGNIVAQFASWSELVEAEQTWSDVLNIVAEVDVITE